MDTSSDSDLDLEQYVSVTDTDQASTEEQNYRKTLRGVCSYMGCTHIPDIDSTASSAEDNPFAAPKQIVGKVSANLHTDDWLCRKMDSLNLSLVQGYPSRSSETGGLQKDQFFKPSKSHAWWYGLHPSQCRPAGSVSFWHCDSAK